MMNAVIIDDEKNALEVLELQLSRFCPGVNVVAAANGGIKGIEAIKKYKPELVFLDIEMPHKNGFDVLNETKDLNYKVVFTTAYDQFAIKAFKFSAIDYLLKPIDITELQQAVEKAKQGSSGLEEKMKLFLQQYQPASNKELIALPAGDAMQFFKAHDIIRCESDSNYTYIFLTGGKKILLSKTLKEIEESLQGLSFFRIHQSHLINMNHVSKFSKSEGSYVIMSDGSNLNISRNRKEFFMEQFRKI
jgi:two-component system, LytTR family, response regulator